MDPSKWFGQLKKKNGGDGYNHSIYDIHSKSCYSDLGSYDRPDDGTPREVFERTPYRDEKIVSVQVLASPINNPPQCNGRTQALGALRFGFES